jgi:hypothetical protein
LVKGKRLRKVPSAGEDVNFDQPPMLSAVPERQRIRLQSYQPPVLP